MVFTHKNGVDRINTHIPPPSNIRIKNTPSKVRGQPLNPNIFIFLIKPSMLARLLFWMFKNKMQKRKQKNINSDDQFFFLSSKKEYLLLFTIFYSFDFLASAKTRLGRKCKLYLLQKSFIFLSPEPETFIIRTFQ